MKNLKKILALALVFAFTLTLFAGAAFTDAAEIGDDYKDDVSMLVELKILGGYPDGSFKPEGNITRAEFCKMVYVLMYGSDSDGSLFATQASSFTDVEGNANVSWAKGFINYCANQNIVGGVGGGKFNPSGNITVAEVSKMLLVLLGCDPAKEGFGGPNWAGNVVSKAMSLGVFNGWVGNSAEPATRQLVAKLMKNTIFAPVYRYNAFTGMGSQYNMDQEENETLGESVMDMSHVRGLVIANENFQIFTDDEAEFIENESGYPNTLREDTSYVRYLAKDERPAYLRIDANLDDSLLGCLVDVYFTAQGKEGSYSQVKLIGNVLVNADTKAYDVSSADIEIFPNGKSSGNRPIVPYITFTADGIERTIKSPTRELVPQVEKNDLGELVPVRYDGEFFTGMSYVCNDAFSATETGDLDNPLAGSDFFEMMGEGSVAKYRIISVDGGDSYSYIFKFQNSPEAFKLGVVSNYSEARNTINVSGIGVRDLEDVILHGDVAQDDNVIMYRQNGKINIEKVETITGAVSSINGDKTVTINDVEYSVDFSLFESASVNPDKTISDFYNDNRSARNEGTKYLVYKNTILDIDAAASVSAADNYAVVINSTYDAGLDTAYVKLAFADNTEGTYEVGRFWQPVRGTLSDSRNDIPSRFAYNNKFGWIYQYSITNDGKVNLGIAEGNPINTTDSFAVERDQLIAGTNRYYASSQTVMFFLYGKLDFDALPADQGGGFKAKDDNIPIKAKAYKLSELKDVTLQDAGYKAITMPQFGTQGVGTTMFFGNVVEDTQGSLTRMVVGMMSYGENPPQVISITDSAAYIAEIKRVYNIATDDWFIEAKLINEDGLQTLTSIDAYDDSSNSITDAVNDIDSSGATFKRGAIVRFKVNSDNKITSITNDSGKIDDLKNSAKFDERTDGFYYGNVMSMDSDLVALFKYGEAVDRETDTNRLPAAKEAVSLHDDYIGIITIRDGQEYAGEYLVRHPRAEAITADSFNAIIQLNEGKVLRIFSFED